MNASRPWLGGLLLTLTAVSTTGAEVKTVEDVLHGSWHTIEVIIFEYATPLEQPSPEDLLHTEERAFPANLRNLAGGAPWSSDALHPDTRACLEQPLPKPAIPKIILHWAVDPTLGLPPLLQAAQPEDQPRDPQVGEGSRSPQGGEALEPAQAAEDLRPAQGGKGPRPALEEAAEHLTLSAPTSLPRSTSPKPAAHRAQDSTAASVQMAEHLTPPGAQASEELPFAGLTGPVRALPPPIEPQLAPHPLLHLVNAAAAFEASLRERSYRWLAPSHLQLRSEANSIRNAEDLALLWHGGWMQPVPEPADGQPVLLQLGQRADAMHQLEGFLEVTQSTILHFRALLWRQATLEPGRPAAATDRSAARRLTVAAVPPRSERPAAAMDAYMILDQSRALRRGALHYLDHPKLGILVQITPVAPPAQLREALRAWRTMAGFDA